MFSSLLFTRKVRNLILTKRSIRQLLEMEIVEFNETYIENCLEIFDSNTPKYFFNNERVLFKRFLGHEAGLSPYFVVILGRVVVGCGGYEVSNGVAGLNWGMVLSDYHGKKIGSKLLQYRLNKIQSHYPNALVKIDTSQYSEGFFNRAGFVTTDRLLDGYGIGLHKVYMQLKLQN